MRVFSDTDGRYPGFDGRVHTAERGHAVYTNFSGWDVYRSEMQLLSLLAPAEASDMVRSMMAFAEQGGAWDRWTVANGYTGVMVSLGAKLGLYKALAHAGPSSAKEVAARSGCAERYVREWLEQQTVAGFLQVENPEAEATEYELGLDRPYVVFE